MLCIPVFKGTVVAVLFYAYPTPEIIKRYNVQPGIT
jgi:hypothetical protein